MYLGFTRDKKKIYLNKKQTQTSAINEIKNRYIILAIFKRSGLYFLKTWPRLVLADRCVVAICTGIWWKKKMDQ